MPELPEVETIKSQLSNYLPFKINKVTFSKNSTNLIKKKDFKLATDTILKIERTGKFLLFYLENPNQFIISHLGMSGSWQITKTYPTAKHAHLILESDEIFLSYVDPRRFGHLYFFNKKNFLEKLNSFPIDISNPDFSEDYVYEVFKSHPNKILKPFLLDQKYFSGIGNYIASEVCARAGLLPDRKVETLKKKDATNIKNAIDLVLSGAVKSSGTTFGGGYRDAFGEKGEGVNHLVVFYQETCQLCLKTKVIKTTMNGRGTYHCPKCQK
jgi:formamidopyrimidine-DNA glycosylase